MTAYELAFPSSEEAHAYFEALSFRRLGVPGAVVLAADGRSDDGRPIVTFARQHWSNRLSYWFTEEPRKLRTNHPNQPAK